MSNDKADRIDKFIAKALEKEAPFELSPGFADRIVAMVESQSLQKEMRRDRWWLVSGIVSLVAAFVAVLFYVLSKGEPLPKIELAPFRPSVGVFTFLSGYSGLVIFGICFVIALHVFDKLIIKSKNRVEIP